MSLIQERRADTHSLYGHHGLEGSFPSQPRGAFAAADNHRGAFVLDPDGHNVEVVNHNR
jgi:hypothetical protein